MNFLQYIFLSVLNMEPYIYNLCDKCKVDIQSHDYCHIVYTLGEILSNKQPFK